MKYTDFKDMLQNKVNNLPMIFAFSSEQLDNALDDMGLSLKDMKGDKLISMGAGAFCLKSDLDYVLSELHAVDDARREFIEDYEHAYDAFFYEMGNHEYHINLQGDWDVLSCFGLDDDVCEYEDGKDVDEYMDAMGLSLVTKAAYHDARDDFMRIAYEKAGTSRSFPESGLQLLYIGIYYSCKLGRERSSNEHLKERHRED